MKGNKAFFVAAIAATLCISSCSAPSSRNAASTSEESPSRTSSESSAELPLFALPAPQPSARTLLPRNAVLSHASTLKDVSDTLNQLLDQAGYADRGFFNTPHGFAIATQMERIHTDGTPYAGSQRWHIGATGLLSLDEGFSLVNLKNALLHADPGHYRIFVFVVTDLPVVGSSTGMPESDARSLAARGAASLPTEFSSAPFTKSYAVTVLVYEFVRASVGTGPNLSIPSSISAIEHLREASILR